MSQSLIPMAGQGRSPGQPSRLLAMKSEYQKKMADDVARRKEQDARNRQQQIAERYDDQQNRAITKVRSSPDSRNKKGSLREFFNQRREIENSPNQTNNQSRQQHYKSVKQAHNLIRNKPPISPGSAHSQGMVKRDSAGRDRSKPLAPLDRHNSASSDAGSTDSVSKSPFVGKPKLARKQRTESLDRNHKKALIKLEKDSYHSDSALSSHEPKSKVKSRVKREEVLPDSSDDDTGTLTDYQKWQQEQDQEKAERLKKHKESKMKERPPFTLDFTQGDDAEGDEVPEVASGRIDDAASAELSGRSEGTSSVALRNKEQAERLKRLQEQQEELDRQTREELAKKKRQEKARKEQEELARKLKEQEEKILAEISKRQRELEQIKLESTNEEEEAKREAERRRREAASRDYERQLAEEEARKAQEEEEARCEEEEEARRLEEEERWRLEEQQLEEEKRRKLRRRKEQEQQRFAETPGQPNHHADSSPRYEDSPRRSSRTKTPKDVFPTKAKPHRKRQTRTQETDYYDEGNKTHRVEPTPPPQPKHNDPSDIYATATDEEPVALNLVPCPNCGRNFMDERLAKHVKVCKTAAKQAQKRKVFDGKKMRLEGTEANQHFSEAARKPEPKLKKNNWKQKHEEFVNTIRYAKKVTEVEAKGGDIRSVGPAPVTTNDDYEQCPHCSRRFNPTAAERHIPRCKDLKTRPPAFKTSKRR